MCSMFSNSDADECLADIGTEKDKRMIERKLAQMAADANTEVQGGLDMVPPMRRMPEDLRGVRKMTIGRHRAYYVGHHSQCSYTLFYVKAFKKSGTNDEDDSRFQRQLSQALQNAGNRFLGSGEEQG